MTVHILQQKQFANAKNKVQTELVHYYINLEEERRLWYFSASVCSHAREHYFTISQAEQLVRNLSNHYGIKRANIEAAIAFVPLGRYKTEENKLFRLRSKNMTNKSFEEQLYTLDLLMQQHLLEYRQALDLVLNILSNYPAARRVIT